MQDVVHKRPKEALRNINRHGKDNYLRKKAVKQFALTLKKGVLGRFDKWRAAAGLKKQKDEFLNLANIVMNAPLLEKLENKLCRKPLREAYNKIKANPRPEKVKAAIKALQHQHDKGAGHAFYLWKLRTLRDSKDKQINLLKVRPQIIDGVRKMQDFVHKRPKEALRNLNRHAKDDKLRRKAVKQLALTLKKGVLGCFCDWRDKAGLKKQKEDILNLANIVMNAPVLEKLENKLCRKPLREAYNKIKANPRPEKVKAAIKAVQHQHDNTAARAFYLWKLRALRDAKDKQINLLKVRP
jgi:hypothetical protein